MPDEGDVRCRCKCGRCGAPPLVAFSGKRQWSELINTGRKGSKKIAKFDVGPQSMRPEARTISFTFACLLIVTFVLSHPLPAAFVSLLHQASATLQGYCYPPNIHPTVKSMLSHGFPINHHHQGGVGAYVMMDAGNACTSKI